MINHKTNKSQLCLACVQCSVNTCVNGDMYVPFDFFFSEQGNRYQTKVVAQVIASQRATVVVFSELTVQNTFKAAG